MAVAYGAATQPGLLSQQYPPPLLPKPGKDNVRLQKLLKRTAKKKASAQASQLAVHFRSSLSPVNEASPDLEHSDHSTPPRTPETPFNLYSVRQPQRFSVRPLYQHVASPYPQRAAYGRATSFSPQTVAMPSYSYSQHITTVSSYSAPAYPSGPSPALGPITQPAVAKISVSTSSASEIVPAAEVKKTDFSTTAETHAGLRPTAAAVTPQPKSLGPTPYPAAGGQALIRPLTVLTPLVKSKSPRPTFKATEPSRSPKPMFDVPQIRMYTASTSYYETSRTPPVYDTSELTAIGSTVPQNKTPTETKEDLTPVSEVRRGVTGVMAQQSLLATDPMRKTPTSDIKRDTTPTTEISTVITITPEVKRATPTSEIKRATPTTEVKRATPTSEVKRATLTPEIKRVTPTPEIKRVTPTPEIKRVTPTPEIKRVTPTPEIKRVTPTSEIKRVTPTSEIKRVTPTPEIKRVTPTSEIKRVTPTPEIKKVTPTPEIKRVTPTSEIKRVTPTPEIKRVTPTSEIKRVTPTPEIKRVIPTPEIKRVEIKTVAPSSEIRTKTPTYEFQISRTSAGRPKTPAYHVTRATTPVFEISRPNPLLFAVSPITVESERSRTPKMTYTASSLSASQSVMTAEPKPAETVLNGDIHLDIAPAAKPIQQSITRSKSEPSLTKEKIPAAPAASQRPKTPTSEPTTPAVTSYGYQRPKTPTYEASRLMTTSPGYKRPKTPTGVSPVAFQRPKTPTQVAQKSKSGYRGLTPAEYAAYGGIKTYSPAFGISRSKTPTQEEVQVTKEGSAESKTPSQESSVKAPSTAEVSVKETPKDVSKPQIRDDKVPATPMIPIIVVSQPSDTSGMALTQETTTVSSQVAMKHKEMVVQVTPKVKPPTAEVKAPEKKKVETPVQEAVKPKPKTPEAKQPLPKAGDKDPLMAVRKLLGKDKVPTPEEKVETKADVSKPKEPVKPVPATKTKAEGSKPSSAAPAKAESEDKEKDKKAEPAGKSAFEKKEGDKSLPAAESLLKVMQKPKGVKPKPSGWSRLKKHMVVEQEEPKFPEIGAQKEATTQDQSKVEKDDQKAEDKQDIQDKNQNKDPPKATQMWDAVLFQMFSSKENIMHQIELNKSEEEKAEEKKDEAIEIPSFAFRLPVLLFSPKFDAKKLKEAASRPVTKISTVFEMGLIGRKGKEEEPKDFNRTARGFAAT